MTVRLPGAYLADPDWLAARLAESGRFWRTTDQRVAGTLWWYRASSELFAASLRDWTEQAVLRHPGLDVVSFALGSGGVPVEVRSGRASADLDECAGGWRATLGAVIGALVQAGVPRARPLWAIAADSLANQALAAGVHTGAALRGADFAVELATRIGPELPRPRFVQIGQRLYCRRNSCCLVDRTGRADKCLSCPRRDPAQRQALLRGR